jgi:hypothetical protein
VKVWRVHALRHDEAVSEMIDLVTQRRGLELIHLVVAYANDFISAVFPRLGLLAPQISIAVRKDCCACSALEAFRINSNSPFSRCTSASHKLSSLLAMNGTDSSVV